MELLCQQSDEVFIRVKGLVFPVMFYLCLVKLYPPLLWHTIKYLFEKYK